MIDHIRYLTRKQQYQREGLSADFLTLNSQGYSSFLRGSQLRYCSHEKYIDATKDSACSMPAIQDGRIVISGDDIILCFGSSNIHKK